jgi:hypothetical protein
MEAAPNNQTQTARSPAAAGGRPFQVAAPRAPKLLDRLHEALRSRHYSPRTEQIYCLWVRRYIHFHRLRHPEQMAEPEINAFLTHLAVKEKVSASTQNQALSALLFLYRHVLGREIGDLGEVIRARKPQSGEAATKPASKGSLVKVKYLIFPRLCAENGRFFHRNICASCVDVAIKESNDCPSL